MNICGLCQQYDFLLGWFCGKKSCENFFMAWAVDFACTKWTFDVLEMGFIIKWNYYFFHLIISTLVIYAKKMHVTLKKKN